MMSRLRSTTITGLDETRDKLAIIPKDILSVEFMGIKLFEKKTPVIESKVLGIPVKYILGGYVILKMLK